MNVSKSHKPILVIGIFAAGLTLAACAEEGPPKLSSASTT